MAPRRDGRSTAACLVVICMFWLGWEIASVPVSESTLLQALDGRGALRQDGWRLGEIPNPYEQPGACGLTQGSPLCDPDGVMTSGWRERVANVLKAIRADTRVSCPDGSEKSFEVGVAVVNLMHPGDWISGDKSATARRFAQELGDRWGVGDAGCDNGAVLFLSLKDRFAFIKTADVSQKVLTDRVSTAIVGSMKPLLQNAQHDDALLLGALQMHDALQGKSISGGGLLDFTFILFFCIFVGCFFWPVVVMLLSVLLKLLLMPIAWLLDFLANRHGQMRVQHDLDRVQSELQRDEFDQTICPICLEALAEDAPGSVTVLDCGHRFHSKCVVQWVNEHTTCPLCRHEVHAPIASEDEDRSKDYQRRLRFYLSRLQHRHPGFLRPSDSAFYSYRDDGNWMIFRRLGGDPAYQTSTYTASLEAHYSAVMQHSRHTLSSRASSSGGHGGSSSGGFGGGGGFSGGGGGGGGW